MATQNKRIAVVTYRTETDRDVERLRMIYPHLWEHGQLEPGREVETVLAACDFVGDDKAFASEEEAREWWRSLPFVASCSEWEDAEVHVA